MGLRITTWNVNGIRNPFGYQPWRDKKTFEAMFDVLEADIVVMQETKIQRKDLGDDVVLVPGWDVYFSLPKHKKGYSGVAIYTRNSVCCPVRAEEGITGILCPPNSTTSFCDLPLDQQIGGYPSVTQLADCPLDAATLDSEGRCMILEFPAFVLIGVYSPANTAETRDEFRLAFLNALDARVRNLVAAGKRVFLTGDINISREPIDSAACEEQLRKQGITLDEWISTPARRLFNQLLVEGKVVGARDEGREEPVLWDICRGFHPGRKGMYTCWETKKNARPGNFGSRIDYVLCSISWRDWFCDSNIQEGLIGSDHCPVYAVIKDIVHIDGAAVHIKDIMNPVGMFKDGVRQRDWSLKDLLPLSAKLIPEFDRRRNIRDMFKKPLLPLDKSTKSVTKTDEDDKATQYGDCLTDTTLSLARSTTSSTTENKARVATIPSMAEPAKANGKRSAEHTTSPSLKRNRSSGSKQGPVPVKPQPAKGQSSLRGFFKPKVPPMDLDPAPDPSSTDDDSQSGFMTSTTNLGLSAASTSFSGPNSVTATHPSSEIAQSESPSKSFSLEDQNDVVDPIVAKESWSRLLSKRVVPRCEHNEPCVSFLTKKPGINCGRSFYICARPLGPSGAKEKGTQWRCGTFIWSSDWTGDGT